MEPQHHRQPDEGEGRKRAGGCKRALRYFLRSNSAPPTSRWEGIGLMRAWGRLLIGVFLLPLAVLVCLMASPLWLIFILWHKTDWSKDALAYVQDTCICLPNRYRPHERQCVHSLFSALTYHKRVSLYSCGCEWCSEVNGIWWPWNECLVRLVVVLFSEYVLIFLFTVKGQRALLGRLGSLGSS